MFRQSINSLIPKLYTIDDNCNRFDDPIVVYVSPDVKNLVNRSNKLQQFSECLLHNVCTLTEVKTTDRITTLVLIPARDHVYVYAVFGSNTQKLIATASMSIFISKDYAKAWRARNYQKTADKLVSNSAYMMLNNLCKSVHTNSGLFTTYIAPGFHLRNSGSHDRTSHR